MVSSLVVTHKNLIATAQFFIEPRQGIGVAAGIVENGCKFVSLWPVCVTQLIGPTGTNRNLDAFHSFDEKLPQGSVETIQLPQILK